MLTREKVTTQVVTITPEWAEKALEGNTHNRPISNGTVEDYASQMKRKLWLLNGEAIVFDYSGRLLDGQHRLWACVDSGASFDAVVVRGVDPETFSTIDTGKKRSAGDVLHIAGIKKNEKTVAAAACVCLDYCAGSLARGGAKQAKGLKRTATRTDVLRFVEKNPQLKTWVERSLSESTWVRPYAANISAVLYLGSLKYREQAEEFILGWLSGQNLGSKSPVLALRNRLGTEKRMLRATRVGLIIHAWNAFVDKRSLTMIRPARGTELVIRGTEKQ